MCSGALVGKGTVWDLGVGAGAGVAVGKIWVSRLEVAGILLMEGGVARTWGRGEGAGVEATGGAVRVVEEAAGSEVGLASLVGGTSSVGKGASGSTEEQAASNRANAPPESPKTAARRRNSRRSIKDPCWSWVSSALGFWDIVYGVNPDSVKHLGGH